MKKRSAFVSVIMLVACSQSSFKNVNNDRAELDLKGNVKFVERVEYTATSSFDELKEDSIDRISTITFTEEGNFQELISKSFSYSHSFKLDILLENNVYVYSEYNNGKKTGSMRNDRGDNNLLLGQTFYDDEGAVISVEKNVYNNAKQLVEWSKYTSLGILVGRKTHYVYDNGLLMQYEEYGLKGKLEYRYLFEYDNKGRVIKETCEQGDGSIYYTDRYAYDAYNNCIENIHDAGSSSYRKTMRYQYDSKGNYVRKETITDGRNTGSIEVRTIIYY